MSDGIDYGMGQTNIDHETSIRFGVIHQNEVLQAWCDSAEGEYGESTCPKCGNEPEAGDETEYHCHDFDFDSDDAYGDEPLGFFLDDGEYKAQSDSYGDIFVIKSPYYTRGTFCSPCAPGAVTITSPCDDGPKAYCFGHDWFEDGKAPYPVFLVTDDSPVLPTKGP